MSVTCLDCGSIIPRLTRCASCERARRQRRAPSGWAWQEIKRQVFGRDGGCTMGPAGCAGPLRVDHIVPLSEGGTSELVNLRALCLEHHQQVTKGGGG
jgi:5-methylcytosine-specific restriction endonuclease McrA